MDAVRTNLLEESYDRIINVGFCIVPYEDLSDIIGPDPMVFGTTKDERIFSFEGVDALFKSQFEQMGNMKPALDRKRIATRISPDGNNAFIVEEITLTLSSPEETNTIFMRASCVMEYVENRWKLTHWHTSTPVDTENDPWHMEEWKRENEKLQKLIDEQTADLHVKNRELEIEAAIERVRARTMAMQHSDELVETSELMFEQVKNLGIELWSCGFSLWYEDDSYFMGYNTGPDGKMGDPLKIPLTEDVFFTTIRDAKRRGDDFIVFESEGESLAQTYSYMDTLPVVGEFMRDIVKEGAELPKYQVTHCGFFSQGHLMFITEKPNPEAIDIFKRFTKVFDQTYTRFLDLQKAEEQAREAQVNLAVERVRARALAMFKSEEILEVVHKLKEEVMGLDIPNVSAATIHLKEPDGKYRAWDLTSISEDENELEISLDIRWHREDTHPDFFMREVWNRTEDYFVVIQGEDRYKHTVQWLHQNGHSDYAEEFEEFLESSQLEKAYHPTVPLNNGRMCIDLLDPPSPEIESILKKMAGAFDLAYKRFEDLQKAEAQAREAQIETALERIRTKTIAMQNTDDIADTVIKFFEELLGLGLDKTMRAGIGILSQEERMKFWTASVPDDSEVILHSGFLDMYRHPLLEGAKQAWANGDSYFNYILEGEDVNNYFQTLNEAPDFPAEFDLQNLPDTVHLRSYVFKDGLLYTFTETELPDDISKTLERFAAVFGQTYTRYLDLEKAEEQAREAKIETALEKIRSRTMAMQKGEELQEVAVLLYKELIALGVTNFVTCGYVEVNEDIQRQHTWVTAPGGDTMGLFHLPLTGDDTFDARYAAWKKQQTVFHQSVAGQVRSDHLEYAITTFNSKEAEEMVRSQFPDPTVFYCFNFSHGYLHTVGGSLLEKEEEKLLARFTKVFEQTYTRFLDLQKAEEQAREAKIETALEKVRSRTMGMQCSDELPEVANLLFLEVQALDIPAWSCGYCILEEDRRSSICIMSSEGTLQKPFLLPHHGEVSFEEWDDFVQGDQTFFTQELGGKAIESHYGFMKSLPQLTPIFREIEQAGLSLPTYQINHLCKFTHGFLLFITYEPVLEAHDIFKRFTRVFDQTYTRFLDLKKAEAQAIEATKQASLDRVRGEIASMRSAEDLEIITPLIWNELKTLDIPFIRCGVFIIHEGEEEIEVYLSKPDGTSLAVMHLPFGSSDLVSQTVDAWQQGSVFTQHWTQEEFLEWGRSMMEQGQVPDLESYQGAEEAPESLHLQFLPFNQGMLYVGSINPLDEEEISLSESLAKAFSIAYARYEDFVKLEKAKAGIEEALSELKATQSQLVQQEKLASLGQLTAGIAHEIKNPLNFVNNFSDLSIELVEEAREEIKEINSKFKIQNLELSDLLDDIETNLKTIHKHGSRADSIVKSMLQHSRGGDGKMEPTPLNPLIKEYVNLAFHGMRAAKEPINVDIDLQLDESVGEVPLIAEDFSRVILNLCNNGFDAMREKLTGDGGPETEYIPKLTVRTKSENGHITIEIEDNGPGIPDDIKDKILQPFFTTKKGTQGTGLGLSITNDIIKAHGGELSVNSTSGSGSKFIITLKP